MAAEGAIDKATTAVGAPLKTAKTHPVGFAVFVIVVILLGMRFKSQIISFLKNIPIVGGIAAKIAGGGFEIMVLWAGAALALYS